MSTAVEKVELGVLKMPDGSTATLYGPADATPAQIQDRVNLAKETWMQSNAAKNAPPAAPQKPEPTEVGIKDAIQLAAEEQERKFGATLDILSTGATGALGTIAGGLAGLVGTVLPGEQGQGDRWREAVSGALTKDLWHSASEDVLSEASEIFSKKFLPASTKKEDGTAYTRFDAMLGKRPGKAGDMESIAEQGQQVKDAAFAVSGGNPYVATAMETVLFAAPEMVVGKSPIRPGTMTNRLGEFSKVAKEAKDKYNATAAKAEQAGYILDNDLLGPSIIRVADGLSPERHAAADMGTLKKNLTEARKNLKDSVDNLYEEARAKKAFASVQPVREMAESLNQRLLKAGFDVADMPKYQKRLAEFQNLDKGIEGIGKAMPMPGSGKGKGLMMRLKHLDILDRRLTEDLRGKKKGDFTSEDTALLKLRGGLRKQLNDMFDNAAISGDPKAYEAWKAAREASSKYKRQFKADRVIRNIIEKDGSPEDIYKWVVGANAMHPKLGSTAVIRRLKEILGDNHPSLVAMRNAAIRDTVQPLFANTGPNYQMLTRNIDRLLDNNPSLVEELNIPVKEMRLMQQAAHAATKVKPPVGEWANTNFMTRTLASIVFGHQIARKGAIVRTAHKIMDRMVGSGRMDRDKLADHLNNYNYTTPVVLPKSKVWAEIMVRGALADMSEEDDFE